MKQKQKMVSINMRARKVDVELIDQAAASVGTTRSALIRQAAEAHARRVLALTPQSQSRHTVRRARQPSSAGP